MLRQRLRFGLPYPEEIDTLIDDKKKSAKRTKVIISSVSALKDSVVNPERKLRNGIQNPRKPAGIPKDGGGLRN